MDKCYICVKNIWTHARKVTCSICHKVFHVKCISLSPSYMKSLQDNRASWYCTYCTQAIFLFNNIEHDLDFLAEIEQSSPGKSVMYLSEFLIPFELNDKDHSSILSETDPDLTFFNSFNHLSYKINYFCRVKDHGREQHYKWRFCIMSHQYSQFEETLDRIWILILTWRFTWINLLSLASLKNGWMKLTLSYTDLMDSISLVNTDILEEVELQFVYRIIWVILKDLISQS